jgi:hypothetical protein
MNRMIEVFNPEGYPPKVVGKRLAPSLEVLDGKTIALVDGKFDSASGMFMEQLHGWFATHYPNVKTHVVGWREAFQHDPTAAAWIAGHADAAIFGVGV